MFSDSINAKTEINKFWAGKTPEQKRAHTVVARKAAAGKAGRANAAKNRAMSVLEQAEWIARLIRQGRERGRAGFPKKPKRIVTVYDLQHIDLTKFDITGEPIE